MKKTIIYLFILMSLASCSKDNNNTNPNTTQTCAVNNQGELIIHNNTDNIWWYSIPDATGSIVSSISANGLDVINLTAGQSYQVTCYYPFTNNGVEYHWNRYSNSVSITQCDSTSVALTDDCNVHNVGYVVYANATTVPITITIDGASNAPIAPGAAEGYAVAAGVTHAVTGTSSSGTYSLSPSVGSCQLLATVLQ